MLRPGHIKLAKDEAAEAERGAGFARKQQWKEQPGNRYTLFGLANVVMRVVLEKQDAIAC